MKEQLQDFDYLCKVVLIGNSSVGKSNIFLRYTRNDFSPDLKSTVSVDYASKIININKTSIKLQIWDTLGSQRFKSISKAYFRGAVGAIVVYDITNENSFLDCQKWLKEVQENAVRNEMIIALVGNKLDLQSDRQVELQRAMEFAEKHDMAFFETSAKDGRNIDHVFNKLCQQICKQLNKTSIISESQGRKSMHLEPKPIKPKKESCKC